MTIHVREKPPGRRSWQLAPPRAIAGDRPVERACYLVGAVLIASGLVHLVVAAVDVRPWYGPLSWRKPITFGLSFGLILMAITWVSSYLRLSPRARSLLLGVFVVDCVIEVSGITIQAWRQVPDHFNNTTPFDGAIAYSLAAGGVVLIVVLGALAATAFRGRIDATPSMRLALRTGFALLVAGLGAGVAMIVRGETLIKSGHRIAAYDTAGSLKGFHGVALNAILLLPALAWWLAKSDRTEVQGTRIVAGASSGYLALAGLVLVISVVVS